MKQLLALIGLIALAAFVSPTAPKPSPPVALDTNGFFELDPETPYVSQSEKDACAKTALTSRDSTQLVYRACIFLITDERRKMEAP